MKMIRQHSRPSERRGATLVEAAIALPLFLLLVFGMIDLGVAVQRYNMASEAARIGARQAIVHGSDAVQLGPWTTTSAQNGIKDHLTPLMAAAGIAPGDFQVAVTYQQTEQGQDDNTPGSTVVVRVSIDHHHLVNWRGLPPSPPQPQGDPGPITVTAESSMIISN